MKCAEKKIQMNICISVQSTGIILEHFADLIEDHLLPMYILIYLHGNNILLMWLFG